MRFAHTHFPAVIGDERGEGRLGMGAPVRVLIADDHPVFLDGLGLLLSHAEGIDVVGKAAGGADAIVATSTSEPDVVVMDLHMPDVDGIEATRRITQATPGVAVLVLTMSD